MASRYRKTFKIVDTEEQAKQFCENENKNKYINKHHKATYTPWTSQNGKYHGFVVWYATR